MERTPTFHSDCIDCFVQEFSEPKSLGNNLARYFTQDVCVNEQGGIQSKTKCRFDLLPPTALFKVTEVLAEGASKYGENNWRQIEVNDHINHALNHLFAYLGNDKTEDHLSHAMCRLLFACELVYLKE